MDTVGLNSRSLPVESHVQRETKLNSNKTNRKTTDRKKIREEKAKTKIKSHIIEFRIKNTLLSEREWSSLLQDVVHDKVKIKSTAYRNGDTYCTAETCSSKKAKEAIFAIHMHNRNSDIKILIEVNETVTKSTSSPSNYNQVDEIMLKSTMDKEARNILTKHNKLINSVLQRIDAATWKLKNEPVIKLNTKGGRNELSSKRMHIEEELYALQDKLQELESQKKEFEDFLSCTSDLLGKFKSSKKNTSALKLVYADFKIEFNHLETALPMYARRTEIVSTVTKYQVSVIVGETGSGKSTQVAQYLYQADLAQRGLIICTQPRKIAATSLATRVAQEMNTSVGNIVGYQVGMQVKRSHATKILYMTDQMLLNQCLKDQKFSQYACIIIDEAHERSVHTDLLLGMIKNCLKIRQDLRVVIMSATIDPEVFVSYFGTCPVIRVAGRTFPVDVIWPSAKDESDNYKQAALEKTIFVHEKEEKGDILTFLTSPAEVEKCCTDFAKSLKEKKDFVCLPLHGRLQPLEQQKVFEEVPIGKRKIVFATNTAETSITIPGIKFVIDTGVARQMQYDPQKNISALNVTTITQSSAEQRKGRAGRTEAGKCFRLFSEDTYSKMELTTKPEILRVHLGQALLKLFELGVNPLLFDFVERPSQDLMDAAVETLELVGAISENQITKLGKWVARLPIDPKFGAFVYTAVKEGIGIEAIIVSACCGASNVFYRSGTEKQKNLADERKIRFCHEGGDFMTMLNVFREWHDQPEKGKASWCLENFINGKVMRGIRETVNEVLNVLKKELSIQLKFVLKPPVNVDDRLQKLLFKMFRKNICHYLGHEKAGYLVVHTDQNVQIFPGSSLKCLGLQPDWMVIEHVLKTSRDYASNVTPVKQSWIDEGLSDCLFSLNIESIHSQRVEQAMSYKIGVQLYADFVGLRYINLRNLEKEIKQNCGAEFVIIEASKEYGEISVYTTPSHVKMVSELVGKRISTLKQKQISEKKEYFLSLSHSGVKVAIGAGLTIIDVLMPNEYTTVLVTVKDNSPSEKEIREYFEQWGTIHFVNQFKNSRDKTKWGKVTYFNKEDAKLSVASTKDNSKMKAIPDTNSQPQMRTTSSFVGITTAKLEWMRPRSMFAFIRFSSTSIVKKACETSIYIKGVCLKIKKDKNNNSGVFVTNIAAGTTEKDLRGTIKTVLSLSPRDITNVSLKKPSTPSPEEKLASLRQLITTEIDKYVKDGDYKLDLIPPREHHSTYNAYLTCTKEEELIATYVGLNNILKIESELVTITIEFTTSLKIPIRIQTKYQSVIDEYSQDFGKKFSIRCRKKEKNGIIWISLEKEVKAETVPQLNAFKEMVLYVKSVISKAIEGKRCGTEDIDDIQNLFTSHGKRFIDKVKNETNALLFIDYRDFTITIHGSELEKAQAFMMLTTYISDLKTGTSKQIPLKGSDKPPGVMKEITLRYESDLNKLQVESGVRYIELDRKRHIVTATGEMRAIETCMTKIQSVIEDLMQRQKENTLQVTKTRVCVVCFCPIEEGDIYRLEICGHSYCKECVQSQLKSSLNSGDLPLTCSSEDCNEKWVLKDIMRIAEKSSVEDSELVQKATSVFVVRNQKLYKYCPTHDCPVIYRLTEKENVFTCSQCDLRICTGCQKEYHDGMTCATAKELEENRRDPDKKFKEWLENTKNVKQCPACSTPIEKIDGCNHMTCVACKAHICWVCLQHFPESEQCYDHLTKYHGGCFDYQFT